MIKRLSRLLVILTLVLTLSVSMFACNDQEQAGGEVIYPEFERAFAYEGVHQLTAPDSQDTWLVKAGVSDFTIVVPATQSSYMRVAKQEFDLLFFDATNLVLPVATDSDPSLTTDGKYISLGENEFFKANNKNPGDEGYDPAIHVSDAEYDRDNLKTEGVRIITKKDVTYILGFSDVGVINGVYTFMNLHFNFEYFYRDTITIDTNVVDERAKVFDVKDVPDIDRVTRNIPCYDPGNEKFPDDLVNGLEQVDIDNAIYRGRMDANHAKDLMSVLYFDNWGFGSSGTIHNVEEYYQGVKQGITNINDTRYFNEQKYYYDEYIPNGQIYIDYHDKTSGIQYDAYAPGRLGNPNALAYVADVDGDGIVDVDENGDGIPDNWEYGNGLTDAQKNVDKDGNGIGDWYEYGDQKSHEGTTKGSLSDIWNGPSVCYTAHGNENSYQALIKRIADCIIQACIRNPVAEAPFKNTMLFSMEDAGEACSCDACREAYKKDHNSYTGAVNRLLNNVMKQYVDPWFQKPENAAYNRKGKFVLSYFVYHGLTDAPVGQDEYGNDVYSDDVVCRDDVGIYFAGGYRKAFENWYNVGNDAARHCFYEWSLLTNHIMIWDYPSYQYGYVYIFDVGAGLNNDYYQALANYGVYFIFAEMQDGGSLGINWHNLNSYIQNSLRWDSTRPIGEYTKKFFDAMYLDASDTMYEIYRNQMVYKNWLTDYYDLRGGAGGQTMGQAKYWPMNVLKTWIDQFYVAIDELKKYETINNGLYLQATNHIEMEMFSNIYLILSLYKDDLLREDYNKYKEYCYKIQSKYGKLDIYKAGSYTSFNALVNIL